MPQIPRSLINALQSILREELWGQQYGISDLFATRSQHRNNLYEVLQILKSLGTLIR